MCSSQSENVHSRLTARQFVPAGASGAVLLMGIRARSMPRIHYIPAPLL